MPSAAETYPEIRGEVNWDYSLRINRSLSKFRFGVHVTGIVGACTRKSYLEMVAKYKTRAHGMNYQKNFFGGECLHVAMDKYAPTVEESASAMAVKTNIAKEEWIKVIGEVYGEPSNRMGELPLVWDVLNDQAVNLWDKDGGCMSAEVRGWPVERWLGVLLGELDSVIPFVNKRGEPAMCIVDNKTTEADLDNYKWKSTTVWDSQKDQVNIYRYMMSKMGYGSPGFGAIRKINFRERFMETKVLPFALDKPEKTEEMIKARMGEISRVYREGGLPIPVYSDLCKACSVNSVCTANVPEEPGEKLDISLAMEGGA